MRKQTKTVAVASAAALLAIGASMTSFAATGWVEEDGQWYYYDKDGDRVEDEWKKSGDNWYWLDSEEGGAMAIDKLIEDDDDTYYVDANGVMVTNTWVKVVNEDQDDDDDPAEYNYYYMQSNGKAYKNDGDSVSKKTIDGKKYAFDEDGKMLYGWVTDDGDLANGEDEWGDALYYFGDWNDGAMKTGWQKITVEDTDDEKDDTYDYWFHFKSNGKKRYHTSADTTWKSNGKYYHFDDRGVMTYEWVITSESDTTGASASSWSYFSDPEDGARKTKGWFKVQAPDEDNTFAEVDDRTFAAKTSDDEDEVWYYSDGLDDGLVVGEIKKIKGKYYGFWPEGTGDNAKAGAMLTGLCALQMNEEDGEIIDYVWMDDMDSDELEDFLDHEVSGMEESDYANTYLYYFGSDDDEDTDGAMRTGSTTINLDGDSYQFMFHDKGGAESRGRGEHGVDDGDYIYKHGVKIKADSDEKYLLVYASGDINSNETVTVQEYDGSDVRSGLPGNLAEDTFATDEGNVKVISNFGTAESGWYLVNTSGKIQTGTKSGTKDGDDWYWFMNDDDIIMYTDDKDLDGSHLDKNGWKKDSNNNKISSSVITNISKEKVTKD